MYSELKGGEKTDRPTLFSGMSRSASTQSPWIAVQFSPDCWSMIVGVS
jgi:hypothetical protein